MAKARLAAAVERVHRTASISTTDYVYVTQKKGRAAMSPRTGKERLALVK
jgi:hypothetical protein